MQKEFEQVQTLIRKHQRFVLTTHVYPDGDGLGCEIALAAFLKQRGKQVAIINHHATPSNYRFLDPKNIIIQFDAPLHSKVVTEADVIFVLDTNGPHRLESLNQPVLDSKAVKICIDHHLDQTDFADLSLIDDQSAATGQILYRLIHHLDPTVFNREIATALYVAIMTDTGSFRFPKTDAALHRIVAHLLECGADPLATYQHIYEEGTPGRFQLLGKALASLQTTSDQKIVYITVNRDMFRETGTGETDTINFISYPLSVQGVQIGILFTEIANGVKISFRSKGDIEINKLAQEFGGNGHKNAAGARVLQARLDDVITNVLERAQHYTY